MKLVAIFMALVIITGALAGCGQLNANNIGEVTPETASGDRRVVVSRDGQEVEIIGEIGRIASFSPPTTQLLIRLGMEDKIIAADIFSMEYITDKSIPSFDLSNPSVEELLGVNADIILSTRMARDEDNDPIVQLKKMGATAVQIPVSNTIEEIKEDIMFIARLMDQEQEGKGLVEEIESQITKYKELGETIQSKKTVYFEVDVPPSMYSFGSGVYLDEIIQLVGAENIFSDKSGWIPIEPEAVISADPDVIITNMSYLETPVEDILNRPGFAQVKAVKTGEVRLVSSETAVTTNHLIIETIDEIAKAIYPEVYS